MANSVRNSRSLTIEDVVFVVRGDAVKVARLKEFISWKDVRKNAKAGDDKAATLMGGGLASSSKATSTAAAIGNGIAGLAEIGTAADFGGGGGDDDFLSLSTQLAAGGDDEEYDSGELSLGQARAPPGGRGRLPSDTAPLAAEGLPQMAGLGGAAKRRNPVRLPWDLISDLILEGTGQALDGLDGEPVDEAARESTFARLQNADRITRNMSRQEYMEFTECRQASFTYKKSKKFRDWLNAAQYTDYKLNDDVLEVLGFVAWEMVRMIVETALAIRDRPHRRGGVSVDQIGGGRREGEPSLPTASGNGARGTAPHHHRGGAAAAIPSGGPPECSLFASPPTPAALSTADLYNALLHIDRLSVNPLRHLAMSGSSRRRLRLY